MGIRQVVSGIYEHARLFNQMFAARETIIKGPSRDARVPPLADGPPPHHNRGVIRSCQVKFYINASLRRKIISNDHR